jgi:hypothetical protein
VSAFLLLVSLLAAFLQFSSSAFAQTTAYAEITSPDVSAFPKITALLNVYDASGAFVTGLKPSDLAVLEDGKPRQVRELTEDTVGTQIVVGINPGPALDVRDATGITRYQRIQQALGTWALALQARQSDETAPVDNLSLVTIAGPLIAHTTPEAWLASFAAFQPGFRATTPNIQSLALSLDAALASTSSPGMKRAILFVTPHMEDSQLEAALNNIGKRAVESHTRINIWLVDGSQYFSHPSALLFQSLAAQTGGGYMAYSGSETIVDPETYFSPLRRIYSLAYNSTLTTSGDHELSVDITFNGTSISSAPQSFTLNILPPNPILVALPAQLTRSPPPDDPYNGDVLLPTEQKLELVFDFPDGHPRPIERTALYVDGELAAENTAAPLDSFTWDLSGYILSGQHELRVEATDSLGLTGSSLGLPVVLTVIKPPSGLSAILARYRSILAWGVLLLAGLILLLILFGSRLRRSRLERINARQQYDDPLTQPVSAVREPSTGKKKAPRPAKTDRSKEAVAWLIRLNPDGTPATASRIPVILPETILGTDPLQATVILDDPALSPLHARIRMTGTGFMVYDSNSVAGTWVNYEPVTQEGYPIKHGDRVHFGHLSYRFELRNPPAVPEPAVKPADS